MNRYLSLAHSLVAFFYLSSCESYSELTERAHQSDQLIALTSFCPKKGGAHDKILPDGEGFDTDVDEIKVYFNNTRASVVSSSGSYIYATVSRLPGDGPCISVVIDIDSVAYEETYAYHTRTSVSAVTGSDETSFLAGIPSTIQIYGRYLGLDAGGDLFVSWRDGGTFGITRTNERQSIVTPLTEADATSRILYASGLTVDHATGMLTAAHGLVEEVTFTLDPHEAWYPHQRSIKRSQSNLSSIVDTDRYRSLATFCPCNGYLHTRCHDGKIAKIDPNTFEGHIIHQGPDGSQYGQAVNPTKLWLLYIVLHSNAPTVYRRGISVLDLHNPGGTGGFKRLNVPGGSVFRDGPTEDTLFNYPKDIKFDNGGSMFAVDYSNHCIHMIPVDNVVTTVAGQPGVAGYRDGGPVESLSKNPWGVTVNEQGDIYIADQGNTRIRELVIE